MVAYNYCYQKQEAVYLFILSYIVQFQLVWLLVSCIYIYVKSSTYLYIPDFPENLFFPSRKIIESRMCVSSYSCWIRSGLESLCRSFVYFTPIIRIRISNDGALFQTQIRGMKKTLDQRVPFSALFSSRPGISLSLV